jgi:hypothetical protein
MTNGASHPAPTLVSAVDIGNKKGTNQIEITLENTATDATLISAYFHQGDGFAETQNIDPSGELGEQKSVVNVNGDFLKCKIRYLWNPTPEIQDSWVWGPFSNEVSIEQLKGGGKGQGGK